MKKYLLFLIVSSFTVNAVGQKSLSVELERVRTEFLTKYDTLGITNEMERAVVDYLTRIGALAACYQPGGGCGAPCPPNEECRELIRGNCACVRNTSLVKKKRV